MFYYKFVLVLVIAAVAFSSPILHKRSNTPERCCQPAEYTATMLASYSTNLTKNGQIYSSSVIDHIRYKSFEIILYSVLL